MTIGTAQCTVQPSLLRAKTTQCAISVSNDMQTHKLHCIISGTSRALPPRIAQCNPGGQ